MRVLWLLSSVVSAVFVVALMVLAVRVIPRASWPENIQGLFGVGVVAGLFGWVCVYSCWRGLGR